MARPAVRHLRRNPHPGQGPEIATPQLYSPAMSVCQPERGAVVRGIISEIHNFGVFVRLDGDPASSPGTGFIRIPELTWDYFWDPAEVVHAGEQVSAEVLDFDATRGQVQLSLKALQEDPLVQFADRVGEVLSGPVVKVVPFGVFVRVAPGIAGLVHESVLTRHPAMGEIVTVTIAEVDRPGRRVRLEPAPTR
ncbi:S1 RNA-binding domain-containing protein [Micromonospora sp. CA-259024]|uniref:S1 RNA-binding domain-containing protein n=1 Tax=Micromonospora sp. CA-259024 TaxID=3239965 RepID=UPI003D8A45DC